MRISKRTLLALAALGTLAAAPRPAGADDKVIKIVSSLPRTGSAKGQTDTIVNGIRLAFEEAGNTVAGFTIVYEDLDDATAAEGQWTSARESANADKAVQDKDVMVYIGPYNSGAAAVSMPILGKAKMLMISPACTAIGLTKSKGADPGEPGKYRDNGYINFTRVVPADDIQGPVAADFLKDDLKKRRVVILDDNGVYGKGLATIFKERCERIGLKVYGTQESIDYKQADFRALLQKLAGERPDALYFGGTSQTGAGQIAKDMVAVGLGKCVLVVPDGCYEAAFIQAAGAETFKTLKCYCTFGGMPPDQLKGKGAEFVVNYKKKFGGADPEGYAVYGYESGLVALEAIKMAGKKDRAAIVAAALSIKDFNKGALGTWSFTPDGDTTSNTLSVSEVKPDKDGKMDFAFVKLLELKLPKKAEMKVPKN